ncbi:MAG TPA: signal peptide peptidase SppA [Virgibacillus sp.]|nr:signal peptide peptidase SppA [Virgibacillus sp.]
MTGKRWAALILAIGLFFVSVVYQIGISEQTNQIGRFINGMYGEDIVRVGDPENKIVVLNLEGIIQDTGEAAFINEGGYHHDQFLTMLDQSGIDESVDGIILKVNTPGGGVVESAEIHDKVVEIRKETEKPIYVSMGNTAASGGYYVSAPADKIVAHPATLTGSIGVIMESINFAELADQVGIDFKTIKSGEFKDIMSSSREMTEDEEVILQTMIDEMYEDFVQVIVDGRNMSEAEVKKLADGRVYTGTQAEELDLVDDIGTLEDTIAMMETDHNLSEATIVEYDASFGLDALFGMTAGQLFQSDSELKGLTNLLRSSDSPRAMYLYSR